MSFCLHAPALAEVECRAGDPGMWPVWRMRFSRRRFGEHVCPDCAPALPTCRPNPPIDRRSMDEKGGSMNAKKKDQPGGSRVWSWFSPLSFAACREPASAGLRASMERFGHGRVSQVPSDTVVSGLDRHAGARRGDGGSRRRAPRPSRSTCRATSSRRRRSKGRARKRRWSSFKVGGAPSLQTSAWQSGDLQAARP